MNAKVNAVDLSAKLLATENVSVRRARVRTASFDIKSRVLTLPMWKEMTPEIEGMLVGHEVGHALYTTDEYMEPIKDTPKIQSYLNVLEDVRIEKLMKRQYPGIRKTMHAGYQQLNERDFFGVGKVQDLTTLLLIDRINLYFKAGFTCGVTFTPQEMQYVRRAEKTETIEEVVQLAKEIYDFSREEAAKRRSEMEQQEPEEVDGEETDPYDLDEIDEDFTNFDDSDAESDGEETDEESKLMGNPNGAGSGKNKQEQEDEQLDKDLESITNKSFYEKLEEMADDNTDIVYHKLDTDYRFDPMIGYKRILEETAEDIKTMQEAWPELYKKAYDNFKPDADRVVNYLIKEFEMKKSAKLYKRAQVSKVGSLDMRKVWAYKLNDDLFKRVTTVPQGKNHGMVMLIDWSGSMDPVLDDTVKQVITLAMFCQRAQIPYQVFAFTSQYDLDFDSYEKLQMQQRVWSSKNDGTLSNATYSFSMLELFSSKMTSVEFNTMTKRLLRIRDFCRCKDGSYATGGTPLNEALGWMVTHLPKFIKANNVEKTTFITLTDGDGGSLHSNINYRYGLEDHRIETHTGQYKRIRQKHFLMDDITKKSYPITRYGNTQTEAILRLIKDRYGVNSVGFYICANNRRDLSGAINCNLPGFTGGIHAMIDLMRKDFRDNGFFSMKNSGRDDLFIIPQSKLAIEQRELEVTDNLNARQIAREFSKVMSNKKTSRVLLNRFIGYVA
jgi:hypothetical protein